jgi:UDP-N-acetylmuramate dehydrogenase
MTVRFSPVQLSFDMAEKERLRVAFSDRLKENEPLTRYTSARIGGPAEFFLFADSADELAEQVRTAWQFGMRVFILGGGANVLVSDAGVRGVVIANRARRVEFNDANAGEQVVVRAESGVNLGALARQCVLRGLAGLEWAATVPGTVGGAAYGNAGAYGGDVAGCLRMAEILQHDGTVREWSNDEMQFGYRTSALKGQRNGRHYVVLAAEFALTRGTPQTLQAKVEEHVAHRKRTQPPGASIGSMFKNPPGDYAGRLIDAAGLKGKRIGNAEISTVHANFFVNLGDCRASDVFALIHLAHDAVKAKFGVDLELEVELAGEWGGQC